MEQWNHLTNSNVNDNKQRKTICTASKNRKEFFYET